MLLPAAGLFFCPDRLRAGRRDGRRQRRAAAHRSPPPVEQTNEGLTIFYTDLDGSQTSIMDAAISLYNQQHPDRLVTAEKIFTDGSNTVRDNETQQMLTEVMAGEGPDLIFFIDDSMDIEKMARRGVFADLEPYFGADNFDWSGYNQTVMDAGVWDGHRLVIPLEYKIPMLYTSQTALDETGFSVENCDTFDGFLTEAEKAQNTPAACSARFLLSMTLRSMRGSPISTMTGNRPTCRSRSWSGEPRSTKI